jgi:tRNA-specific 2-thiouridylase
MVDKVIVGVSGGVDSSVAAMLLKQQGYAVEALFMKNWDEQLEDGSCLWEADVADAMQVCERLDIPLNTIDLSIAYWERVFTEFVREYASGRTPNPDILCNQEVKFKAFLEHALALGADRIATGHYARLRHNHGRMDLLKGSDPNKDQSYFLCRLTQRQLGRTLFPIGEMHKAEVRKLAARAGLATHAKKDSTGICFVGERPFRDFLSRYLPVSSGAIKTLNGRVVGEHPGIQFYTLGQRQGLRVGGVKGARDEPWYVVSKDVAANTLIIAQGHEHPLLYSRTLCAVNLHWIRGNAPAVPVFCMAKTRYRQADQECELLSLEDGRAEVRFKQPQRAVTPGQYIVFYQDDICLGGGVIDSTG